MEMKIGSVGRSGDIQNGSALEDAPLPVDMVHEPRASVFYSDSDLELAETMKEKDDGDRFELMHIQIVIYGVSGILCVKEEPKRKPPSRTGSGLSVKIFSKPSFPSPPYEDSFSVPSMVLTDASNITEEDLIIVNKNATLMTAVVSFNRNAISSDTSIESFLPSLPLCKPAKPEGPTTRYNASWPAEKSVLNQSEDDVEQSSFKFTRCMRQENYVPGMTRDIGAVPNYTHETVNLNLSLSKGTELIRLGVFSLAISGDEEGEFQMHIPIKPIIKTKRRNFKPMTGTKWNKYGYFSDELDRRYHLAENATARVGIKVIPHYTIKAAEEREREEMDAKFFGRTIDVKDIIPSSFTFGAHRRMPKLEVSVTNGPNPEVSVVPVTTARAANGILSGLFCGALVCAQEPQKIKSRKTSDIPETIETANDVRRQFGAASLISSVSESSDETSITETETERVRHPSQPPNRLFPFGTRTGI